MTSKTTHENNSPHAENECEQWEREIQASLDARAHSSTDESPPLIRRVKVVERASSTQDECLKHGGGETGFALVALHQTAGRGRMGRRWYDPNAESVACTVTWPSSVPGERLALSSGIAAAVAAERLGAKRIQIRWPNDVMARKHKLAGVIIERKQGMTLVGIGMNVEQKEWENGLDGIAISLAQLGIKVHKRDVVKAILNALTDVAAWDIEKLESEFRRRDALKGHVCVFRCGTKEIIGRVKRIDPLRGLIVDEPTPMPGESAAGGRRQLFLPALTTSLVRITTAARGRAQAE